MPDVTLPDDADRCPCTNGDVFGSCCGPVIATGVASTAVRLMRSRFTAFAIGSAEHLRRTWHPRHRPASLELDPQTRWRRLDILAVERGGPFDTEGVVEFEAFYREPAGRGSLRERSRFTREKQVWFYVDGIVHTG